jgi:hypothetical protein
MKLSFLFAECACGEAQPSALVEIDGEIVCGNCEARRRGKPEATCGFCGEQAPFENHHVDGKSNSHVTMIACINCHRKHHNVTPRNRK